MTADEIRAHTSQILLARAAYNADQLVSEGRCSDCGRGNPDPEHRRCQACRKDRP